MQGDATLGSIEPAAAAAAAASQAALPTHPADDSAEGGRSNWIRCGLALEATIAAVARVAEAAFAAEHQKVLGDVLHALLAPRGR